MLSPRTIKRILIIRLKHLLNIGSKPDFLILGAQKAGTTALFKYIEKYALNFRPPVNKELYFFTEHYEKGMNYYKALFPFKTKNTTTGEATPDYLFYHLTPKRVFQSLGKNLKMVVILRDPKERAFSQYNHQNYTEKTKAFDNLTFSEAIRKESERFMVKEDSDFFYEYKYFSYLARGRYAEQIENWLKYYSKESQNLL